MQILIGTKNEYKIGEMMYMLKDIENIDIHLLKDTDINLNIEENGNSLKENAEKKAKEISKYTNMYVLTSDGGMNIPGLGSKWNMLTSQRNVGEGNTDLEKAKKLLNMMNALKGEDRRVEYRLALVLGLNGNIIWSGEGIIRRGYVAEKLYSNDVPDTKWTSHLWYYPELGKVHNQLNDEELNIVRKREDGLKRDLEKFIKYLV